GQRDDEVLGAPSGGRRDLRPRGVVRGGGSIGGSAQIQRVVEDARDARLAPRFELLVLARRARRRRVRGGRRDGERFFRLLRAARPGEGCQGGGEEREDTEKKKKQRSAALRLHRGSSRGAVLQRMQKSVRSGIRTGDRSITACAMYTRPSGERRRP